MGPGLQRFLEINHINLIVSAIAVVLNLAAFGSQEWVDVGVLDYKALSFGLWKMCVYKPGGTALCRYTGDLYRGWFNGVQATATLGALLSLVGLTMLLWFVIRPSCRTKGVVVTSLCCNVATVIFNVIALAILIANVRGAVAPGRKGSVFYYGWGFDIAWVSTVLHLLNAVYIGVGMKTMNDEGRPYTTQA